jgi:hypothetical protein
VTMSDKTQAQLETEMAALQARLAEIEAKLGEATKLAEAPFIRQPQERFDPTAGMSMDRETMRDLASAIPDSLARDLRADLARGNPVLNPSRKSLPNVVEKSNAAPAGKTNGQYRLRQGLSIATG